MFHFRGVYLLGWRTCFTWVAYHICLVAYVFTWFSFYSSRYYLIFFSIQCCFLILHSSEKNTNGGDGGNLLLLYYAFLSDVSIKPFFVLNHYVSLITSASLFHIHICLDTHKHLIGLFGSGCDTPSNSRVKMVIRYTVIHHGFLQPKNLLSTV